MTVDPSLLSFTLVAVGSCIKFISNNGAQLSVTTLMYASNNLTKRNMLAIIKPLVTSQTDTINRAHQKESHPLFDLSAKKNLHLVQL